MVGLWQQAEKAFSCLALSEPQREALARYLSDVRRSPRLLSSVEEYYAALFGAPEVTLTPTLLCAAEDEESGALFAVIYLARLALLPKALEARGIPSAYASPAAWHYRDLLQRNYHAYGSYGFCGMYRDGMWGYLRPTRFTLGRLNFEPGGFHAPYRVYRNIRDGRLLPLANGGIGYLADGRPHPKGSEAAVFFETACTEHDGVIDGYTFDGAGRLLFEGIRLDSSVWRPVLSEGDDVLWVHIPSNGPLLPDAVEESLRLAKEFFSRYEPTRPFRAFVCSSWLLDSALREHLRPDANILRFQERFCTVLSRVNPTALYWNVFGVEKPCPLSSLVPRNALQSGLLAAAMAGTPLYSGNGFLMLDEL